MLVWRFNSLVCPNSLHVDFGQVHPPDKWRQNQHHEAEECCCHQDHDRNRLERWELPPEFLERCELASFDFFFFFFGTRANDFFNCRHSNVFPSSLDCKCWASSEIFPSSLCFFAFFSSWLNILSEMTRNSRKRRPPLMRQIPRAW